MNNVEHIEMFDTLWGAIFLAVSIAYSSLYIIPVQFQALRLSFVQNWSGTN